MGKVFIFPMEFNIEDGENGCRSGDGPNAAPSLGRLVG